LIPPGRSDPGSTGSVGLNGGWIPRLIFVDSFEAAHENCFRSTERFLTSKVSLAGVDPNRLHLRGDRNPPAGRQARTPVFPSRQSDRAIVAHLARIWRVFLVVRA
jgi:hypothetical protein